MDEKSAIIEQMKAAGYVRHNGTEWGDNGKSAKGKQHKSGKATLSQIVAINKWLRHQDEWWISPDGTITHYSQFNPTP